MSNFIKTPLDHEHLICLDVETTGLSPVGEDKDEILTLSICDGYGNELFEGMFKPMGKTHWEGAQAVNGISPEMVSNCPPITSCLEQVQAIIDSAEEIIGYNVGFDLRFLRAAGFEIDEAKYKHEPMYDFAEIYGEFDGVHDNPKWQKLTTAAKHIGYVWKGTAHESMADVLASLALAEWLYDEGNYKKEMGIEEVEETPEEDLEEKKPSHKLRL